MILKFTRRILFAFKSTTKGPIFNTKRNTDTIYPKGKKTHIPSIPSRRIQTPIKQLNSQGLRIALELAKTATQMLNLLEYNSKALNTKHLTTVLKYYDQLPDRDNLREFVLKWVSSQWDALNLGERGENSIAAVAWHLREQPTLKDKIINSKWQQIWPSLNDKQFTLAVNGLMASNYFPQVFEQIKKRKSFEGSNRRRQKLFGNGCPQTLPALLLSYVNNQFEPAYTLSIWRHFLKNHQANEQVSAHLRDKMINSVKQANFSNQPIDYGYLLHLYVQEIKNMNQSDRAKFEKIIQKYPLAKKKFISQLQEKDQPERLSSNTDTGNTTATTPVSDNCSTSFRAHHFSILAEGYSKLVKNTLITLPTTTIDYLSEEYEQLLSTKLTNLRMLANPYYFYSICCKLIPINLTFKTVEKYIQICEFQLKNKGMSSISERVDPYSIATLFPQLVADIIKPTTQSIQTTTKAKLLINAIVSTLNVLQQYKSEKIHLSAFHSPHSLDYLNIVKALYKVKKYFTPNQISFQFSPLDQQILLEIAAHILDKIYPKHIGNVTRFIAIYNIKTKQICASIKQKYNQMSRADKDKYFGANRDQQKCFLSKKGASKCVCISQNDIA